MKRTTICFLGGVFALMLVVAAPGFQQAVPGLARTDSHLQVEPSTEVVLNVVADDGHGRLVGDLNRDEFQVFEDGQQQPVFSFERHEDGPQPVLILLDVLNTYFGARGRAQEEIVTGLQRLKAAETVYFYVLSSDGAVQAVHAMPDTTQTQKDVTPWTRDARAMLDQALRNTLRPPPMAYASTRAEATYTALKKLASRLAEAPGRKAIVWVTHGVPTRVLSPAGCFIDYEPPLQQFTAAFGQVEIAIYSVAQSATGAIPDTMNSMECDETLRQFADLTGGRKYPSDHIEEAISQALADNRLSYRLGYHQQLPGKTDAGYRKVRVACTRRGIRVHSRQGYYPQANVAARL